MSSRGEGGAPLLDHGCLDLLEEDLARHVTNNIICIMIMIMIMIMMISISISISISSSSSSSSSRLYLLEEDLARPRVASRPISLLRFRISEGLTQAES